MVQIKFSKMKLPIRSHYIPTHSLCILFFVKSIAFKLNIPYIKNFE